MAVARAWSVCSRGLDIHEAGEAVAEGPEGLGGHQQPGVGHAAMLHGDAQGGERLLPLG